MSRYYEMRLTIREFDLEKVDAITAACKEEWPFEDVEVERGRYPEINSCSDGSLYGGESEEEFADRLAEAIWKANGKYCYVNVDAVYLEDWPYLSHERDRDKYKQWKKG